MKSIRTLCFTSVLVLISGCASILGSPMHNVQISSFSEKTAFSIVDEAGEEVAKGTTPEVVTLRSSNKPFRAAQYVVNFDVPGNTVQSKVLKAKFSPWYFVNIIGGYAGWLGLLVIDPFTGSLYQLPNESRMSLEQ